MNLKLRQFIVASVLCLVALASAGCKDDRLSWSALTQGVFGPSRNEIVAMMFQSEDPDRRREGVILLSQKEYGLREPCLKGYALLLEDEDASVRSAAVRVLGKAGDAKYLPNIVAALEDESEIVRWDAATALDRVHGEAAVIPLQKHALGDPYMDVRICCARALRAYRRDQVVNTLVQCLSDRQFSVCHEAHRTLVMLTGRDMGYEPEDWAGVTCLYPSSRPAARDKKPWWDWMGVAKEKPKPPGSPKLRPATRPAARDKKPWWDWMGMTKEKPKPPGSPKPKPATRPAAKSAGEKTGGGQ